MRDNPDENQNNVKWKSFQNFRTIDYVNNQNGLNIIEEHLLAPQ